MVFYVTIPGHSCVEKHQQTNALVHSKSASMDYCHTAGQVMDFFVSTLTRWHQLALSTDTNSVVCRYHTSFSGRMSHFIIHGNGRSRGNRRRVAPRELFFPAYKQRLPSVHKLFKKMTLLLWGATMCRFWEFGSARKLLRNQRPHRAF